MKEKKQLSPFEQKLNSLVRYLLHRIPFVQKIFFVNHLRVMTGAGLSLVESLTILSKEVVNPAFRDVIGQIKEEVEKGNQLSDVLAKFPKVFPPIYVKMVAAGEISGKLEEALGQIEIQMKKTHELTSTIRSAMIYPAVILSAMAGVGVMMVVVVLPKLIKIFEEFDSELPLATRILIVITNFLSNPFFLALTIVLVIGFITLFIFTLKHSPDFRRSMHQLNLHLPIAGSIIKQINLARFSLTLSSLLKSTIPIITATTITADTCTNILYREALAAGAEKLKSGAPLSEVLEQYPKLFPPMVTQMIMVGERSGEIDSLLEQLSIFYGDEVNKVMKNFATIIEPVIIILLGLAVGGMAVAVIMPMYSLVQNF